MKEDAVKPILAVCIFLLYGAPQCAESLGVIDLTNFTGDGKKALADAYAIPDQKASQEAKLVDLTKNLFLKKVRDDNEQHRLLACIIATGFIGTKYSVNEVLLPHITYEREVAFSGRTPLPRHDYPCVGALIDIGFASLPAVISYLKAERSDFEIKLALYAIQSICAKATGDPTGGKLAPQLISCFMDDTDRDGVKNLKKALSILPSEIPSAIKP